MRQFVCSGLELRRYSIPDGARHAALTSMQACERSEASRSRRGDDAESA